MDILWSLMYCFIMSFQVRICRKASIVNETLEFRSLIYTLNIIFQVPTFSKASQMEHLKGFCPSWTVATCFFKWLLWANLASQTSHMNGFCPSWTEAMWKFKCCFFEKLESHIEHLNGFFPSWTEAMWIFIQILLFWKAIITLVWFLPLMYCWNMMAQISLYWETNFTNKAIKWFLPFMDWNNVSIYISF